MFESPSRQVDSKIKGNICCPALIVAESGEVTGKVTSESATIHGTLTGTVQSKSVTLSTTARVVGDLAHETLTSEPGAHIKGQAIPVESKKDGGGVLSDARASVPPPQKPKEAAQGSGLAVERCGSSTQALQPSARAREVDFTNGIATASRSE